MGGLDKVGAILAGRSVLRWSVEALVAGGVDRIALVTSPERLAETSALVWLPEQVVALVGGGERRQESVAAGVAALAERAAGSGGEAAGNDPIILVHDAARPLASPDLVRAVAAAAAAHGAAIPVSAVAETLKRVQAGWVVATVDRAELAAAQTPQGVRHSLLEAAYAEFPPTGPATFTDEAALLEACRIPVHAIEGETSNLKVTLPTDLERAEALLVARAPGGSTLVPARPGPAGVRVGFGSDAHPFGPGEPLALGALRIPGAPRLQGHSDGDVALHAVADALLGGAGLGDLGRAFPAGTETPPGADSRELLSAIVARVGDAGWRPVAVDLTIVIARPKLAERLPQMAAAIASILGLVTTAVNVKASTGNLLGFEGEGRGASASAVVVLEPLPPAAGSGESSSR